MYVASCSRSVCQYFSPIYSVFNLLKLMSDQDAQGRNMDRVSRRRKLCNKLMGTLVIDLRDICSCIAVAPWYLFILFTAIAKRVVQLCAADNFQFCPIVEVPYRSQLHARRPHSMDPFGWLIVDFFSLIVKTTWDLFILITLIAVPVDVDFFISSRRRTEDGKKDETKEEQKKEETKKEEKKEEKKVDLKEDSARSEDSSHSSSGNDVVLKSGGSSFLTTDSFPSAAVSTPDYGGISVLSDQNVVFTPLQEEHESSEDSSHSSSSNDVVLKLGGSSFLTTDSSPSAAVSTPDYGGISVLSDQNVVFTPLEEEEHESWLQGMIEFLWTDPVPVSMQIMPTISPQVSSVTSFEIPNLPTLQQEVDKLITTPSSSQPRVDKEITSIAESITPHNLDQECSRETEINLSMNEKLDSSLLDIQISQHASSSVIHSEAFQHGGVISVEFDPTNTGGDVVTIDNNFTTQAHSEIKSTIHTCEITSQDLQKVVGLKRSDAAKTLGAAEGPSTRSSHTEGVGSSHQNSPGFEPEPQGKKTTLSPLDVAMQEANGAREFSRAILTDRALEQDMATFPSMVPNVRRMQDARTWTIKATYGEYKLRFQLSSKKITELKDEVAKRLQLELNSFDIHYEDDDKEWILIACDEDLEVCLDFSSSMGNQKTRLLITDKKTR